MRVAVVGLGPMGSAMAGRLLDAGHALRVFNRTAAKAAPFAARGAFVASSPAEAAEGCELAITIVADDAATEAMALGADGVAAGLPQGATHLVMGTISVALADRLEAAHRGRGQVLVSAPVLGRPPAAAAGQLYVMPAGDPAAIERARPVFDAIGQRVFVIGTEPRQAALVKLCCNFLIFSTIEQLGEVFALAAKGGVAPETVFEVLVGSFFGAPVHRNYGRLIVEGRFDPPGAKVTLAAKDTRLLLEAGEQLAAPLPFASIVRDRLLAAVAQGEQDKDFAIIGRHAARDAGLG
jgi:3-hydroxyisobutyrate dehydrogenase-like beta-hydroxyacid dehydrogenase